MILLDAVAFDFMRPFTRSVIRSVIKWHHSGVTHERYYWLWSHIPTRNDRLLARQNGQSFTISPEQTADLSLLLRDDQLNLDEEITEFDGEGTILYQGLVQRTPIAIYESLMHRGDPASIVRATVRLPLIQVTDP